MNKDSNTVAIFLFSVKKEKKGSDDEDESFSFRPRWNDAEKSLIFSSSSWKTDCMYSCMYVQYELVEKKLIYQTIQSVFQVREK